MIGLYIAAGLVVSLILYDDAAKLKTKSDNKSLKNILPAIVLTSVFWPFVMLLVAFESIPKPKRIKVSIKSHDLTLPVNINSVEQSELVTDPKQLAPDLPFGSQHAKWQALKHQSNNEKTIWAFKTHSRKRNDNKIVEGYALVDQNRNIVDYLVTAKYKDSYPQKRATH
ncbi:hypothetical protein N9L48_02815 [Psychrosphaera sp.]|nr:hypothetical protein [Psychrosphaera sp.]